jgi:hypothetical protein
MSNYLQILETIFVKPNFTINVLDLADTYTDIEEQLIINIFQINSNSNNNSCVKFIIYYENESKTQTNLYIFDISKIDENGNLIKINTEKVFYGVPKSIRFLIGTRVRCSLRDSTLSHPQNPIILDFDLYGKINSKKYPLNRKSLKIITNDDTITESNIKKYYDHINVSQKKNTK